MNVVSHIIDILLRRELLQNHLIVNLALLKSKSFNTDKYITKSYIDHKFYPATANVTDQTKDNLTQPLSTKEILELHLKTQHNSWFVNNYFDVGLSIGRCTVYHILPKLKLRRNFAAAYFVNTNLSGERVKVLLFEKELSELPDDSPNIFKKSNIGRYMERPKATFCNGKYSVFNYIRYTELLAYYTFENKSSKTCEYQPNKFDDNLVEYSHEECSNCQTLN